MGAIANEEDEGITGDLTTATGDLATARNEYQVSFDIFARLTDLDPLNAQWRSDREIARRRLDSLDRSGEGQA